MSKLQKLIVAIAQEMQSDSIDPAQLFRMAAMLDGIHEVYHLELLLAAFSVKEDET